ncbi:hypothetical protein [Pseudoalteromonas rubra]|uniref:hypothetical protein n=1 Tax=Pseudoalteromonas rubra TaxID=43658 RepID=UPI000F793884|nr:hypothetical protein [Pseudoalteromonas rubra]
MFRIIVLIFFALASVNSFACFQPPEGIIESHELQAKLYFTLAIALLIAAITLRLLSERRRVWVPLLFITSFTYFPAYLWHWGQAYSGACGIPEIVLAFQIWAGGLAVLCIYETLLWYKQKRIKAK